MMICSDTRFDYARENDAETRSGGKNETAKVEQVVGGLESS